MSTITWNRRRTGSGENDGADLYETLLKLDICPLELSQVEEMARVHVSMIAATALWLRIVVRVAVACFLLGFAYLFADVLNNFSILVFCVLFAVVYIIIADSSLQEKCLVSAPPGKLYSMSLETYARCSTYAPLPSNVRQAIGNIRKGCSSVTFIISVFEIGGQKNENFLFAQSDGHGYLIMKWGA